jgi:hypothetical protein
MNPTSPIAWDTRKLMRNVASYVPECGSICAELTYHILSTGPGNTRCLKHAFSRPKRMKVPAKNADRPVEDRMLNCGCEAKNALYEFYFYKTGQVIYKKNGEDTSANWSHLQMPVVLRELVFEQVADETCWSLDDIWRYKKGDSGRYNVLVSRVVRIQDHINRLTLKLDGIKEEKKQEAETYSPRPGPSAA